jgi:hypothetical protein
LGSISSARAYIECNARQRAKWKDAQYAGRYTRTMRDMMSVARCVVMVRLVMHASAEAAAAVEVMESPRVQ